MALPTDSAKHAYMFSDDMKFVQKVVLRHPTETDKFLALKRSATSPTRPNDWDLPGGNVLFGELHHESLVHEIMEETGIKGLKLFKPQYVSSNYRYGTYILFIGYTAIAPTESITLSHEHQDHRWVTTEEFLTLCKAQYLHDFIKSIS